LGRTLPREFEQVNKKTDKLAPVQENAPAKQAVKTPQADDATSDKKSAEAISPEISVFFTNPKLSPSVFLKVLKSEKVKRFKKEDEQKALIAIEGDTNGDRLWALMSQANLPEAVERWIWTVAQNRLKFVVGHDFNPLDTNPTHILRSLRKALDPGLRSKEKSDVKHAENWLRIGICWLMEKRSIQIWTVAELISSVFFTETKNSNLLVHRAISKGSIKELKLSVATVTLGNEMVTRAKSDLADERRLSNSLRIKLSEAEKRIEGLTSELVSLRDELTEKEKAFNNISTQLENERHHWGHDLSETKAGQRVLLGERVAPLLSDAVDALEIDPPAPNVALKRIKAVLNIIGEEST
jgi:hypothetical protein